ncbi:Probable adenylyltransferase/sulfurtransferase MoeZ [Geodia barretti]|uniref:Probable adenylyltransferase/sulfurtransferase MoeZ n=1 Tax=Geodia barretti TaxID=519541 RepID=A0AA35T1U5_GEOBA|nr:Probable adenylyltransferase/sulfurtransferase MoeZ [Geodia barretti]
MAGCGRSWPFSSTTTTSASSRRKRRRSRRETPSASSRRWRGEAYRDDPGADQRRGGPLQPAPDHAGGRHGRAAQAEGGQRALHRRRRSRLAGRDVPGRGRRRPDRDRRLRRGRLQQPAAADHSRHTRRGPPKLDSARDSLAAINPEVRVDTHNVALSSSNALDLFREYDIIVDGTDNFPTRYLVNDACVLLGKPNCYGSIFRFEGQASVFGATGGPCYRCLYPEPPPPGLVPSCAEGGVLGILPGVVGTIQATEAVKLIMGAGEPLIGRFLIYDALRMRFRELKLRKDPDCPVCGEHPTVTALIDYDQFCGIAPPASAAADPPPSDDATVEQLKARLDQRDEPFILDVREPQEYQICNIPGSTLIPLGDLPSRLHELEGRGEMIVHCKSGARSAKAVKLLREAGFAQAKNLRGGILRWIDAVDPTLPKY